MAWSEAIARVDRPACLLFTRQSVPFNDRDAEQTEAIHRGGYVLRDSPDLRAVVIATGSEVALAVGAREQLAKAGIAVRVVSIPCTSVFDRQEPRLSRERAASGRAAGRGRGRRRGFWHKYVGAIDDPRAAIVGIDRFGESAPAGVLFKHFGFTVEHVVAAVTRAVTA